MTACTTCRHAQWREDLDAMYCHHPLFCTRSVVTGKPVPTWTSALRRAPSERMPALPTCGPEGRYWEGRI